MASRSQEKITIEESHVESVDIGGSLLEEVTYTESDAKAVRRKLDLWLMPVLMLTYGLQ